jgi:bifunctional non-homologous end joining protein LigD
MKTSLEIEGREVQLSNLDKVLFPGSGTMKGEIIDYYIRVSEYLLPHLEGRPLTLKRFPNGVLEKHFYEKNAPSHTPDWVTRCKVKRSEGGIINYILVNDLSTLVWVVNTANIEMHTLLSRTPNLSSPSFAAFDLDPGPGTDVLTCGRIALVLR